MDDGAEFCRQRMLEEQIRAVAALDEERRRMHLQWAELYEERLLSLRLKASGSTV